MEPIDYPLQKYSSQRSICRVAICHSRLHRNNIGAKIWTLEFNELGVTKLDRELSLFIGNMCGLNYNLREKFLKLTQIVLLLGLDDDNFDLTTGDIKDDFNGTFDWVINSQERIKARNMKIDRTQ